MKKAVFVDRDGVLNEAPVVHGNPISPMEIGEFEIVKDAKVAIELLVNGGFEIVVITNQPEISRGRLELSVLEEMHKTLSSFLGVKNFYVCPHDDLDFCECRKPKSGLITQAVRDLEIDIKSSFLIGDRWKDIEAGKSAGCKCIFIDKGYREKQPSGNFLSVKTLWEAACNIIER